MCTITTVKGKYRLINVLNISRKTIHLLMMEMTVNTSIVPVLFIRIIRNIFPPTKMENISKIGATLNSHLPRTRKFYLSGCTCNLQDMLHTFSYVRTTVKMFQWRPITNKQILIIALGCCAQSALIMKNNTNLYSIKLWSLHCLLHLHCYWQWKCCIKRTLLQCVPAPLFSTRST